MPLFHGTLSAKIKASISAHLRFIKYKVIEKISDFIKDRKVNYVTGRGWDQNDWPVKAFPTKEKLLHNNSLIFLLFQE